MTDSIALLSITAATIGFVHTIVGPDHYLPFILMARAGNWSRGKTMWITLLCGIGHVVSSVVLGTIGILFGVALQKLELIESVRGDIAAWALIAFGIAYTAWGLRHAYRKKEHHHVHHHDDGTVHLHGHAHHRDHSHVHESKSVMTTWALFTVFVLGPCEPLIPILMYPAARESGIGVIFITAIFGVVTIATMLVMVLVVSRGLSLIPLKSLERYSHAIAGIVIAVTGVAVQFLGL